MLVKGGWTKKETPEDVGEVGNSFVYSYFNERCRIKASSLRNKMGQDRTVIWVSMNKIIVISNASPVRKETKSIDATRPQCY